MTSLIRSISIKKNHIALWQMLEKQKPKGLSISSYILIILEDYIKMKNGSKLDFTQPMQFWNDYLSNCTDKEYADFFEQLYKLNDLERVKTRERLQNTVNVR